MRREDKEISDSDEIEGIIQAATVCYLALWDGCEPYLIPLNFGYTHRKLYFHSARQGRKLDLIRRNSRVGFALAIDTAVVTGNSPCGWTMRYRSVVGRGTATIVDDSSEKIRALDLIMAHYGGPTGGYDPQRLASIAIIRVDIGTMSGKRSA